MTCGEKIKHLRKELGLSADELGALIGKTRATIYRYENGEIADIPITILEPLARALNASPAYLLGFDESTYFHSLGKTESLENIKIQKNNILNPLTTEVYPMLELIDSDEIEIINIFRKLNSTGKLEALKRLEELYYIPTYYE